MTKADSENGSLPRQLANAVMRVCNWFGIAWTVGQEHTVRLEREDIFCAGFRRHYGHVAALVYEHPQDVLLDAIVVGNYMQRVLRTELLHWLTGIGQDRTLIPGITLLSTHHSGEVGAVHFGNGTSLSHELVRIRLDQRDHSPHHPVRSQVSN